MKNSKNLIEKIIIAFFIIIFITSIYFLVKSYLDYKKMKDSMEELKEDVIQEDTKEETSLTTPIIDWEKLKAINADIIGWIRINNTNIDYPILHSKDDLYYLKHNYMKEYNSNGSIFTINDSPFKEEETIVHGHNMKNNIMFAELSKYLQENFFYSNNTFEVYTPECNYKATIFSAYSIDVNVEKNNIKSLSFEKEVEYYINQSKYPASNVKDINKIIKLSTCSYLNSKQIPTEKRYYIIAKLENL